MATAAPALAAVGREDEARALSARELAAAAAFGAPRRYGVALSVRGMLDPGPLGLERLGEAVARGLDIAQLPAALAAAGGAAAVLA